MLLVINVPSWDCGPDWWEFPSHNVWKKSCTAFIKRDFLEKTTGLVVQNVVLFFHKKAKEKKYLLFDWCFF